MISRCIFPFALAACVVASEGDRLTEFKNCVEQCLTLMKCDHVNIFEQIELERLLQNPGIYRDQVENAPPELLGNRGKRDVGIQIEPELTQVHDVPPQSYSLEDFTEHHRLQPIFQMLFRWDCTLDCDYKCRQLITNQREVTNLPMVQFYGKWPFTRVFGITEFFSTVFSIGNLYVNWHNLHKILKQYNKNKKHGGNTELADMYRQYLILLLISILGWTFSTLFHIRDFPLTETLDYFGASAIILANFNAIVIRYFGLFQLSKQHIRRIFQLGLVVVWVLHLLKLRNQWDYSYNILFNMVFGITAMVLWILHSLKVTKMYNENDHIYGNSMQLLPFETKILTKLNYVGIFSKTKYIPLLPILLNLWIISGMSFELLDFEPWHRLIDAHSIWHLFTIFPTIIWYDWNIWELETYNISTDLAKLS